jgi:hypothetical protein
MVRQAHHDMNDLVILSLSKGDNSHSLVPCTLYLVLCTLYLALCTLSLVLSAFSCTFAALKVIYEENRNSLWQRAQLPHGICGKSE